MKITTVANAIHRYHRWLIGGLAVAIIFNACSPNTATIKTADQAKEKCLGYLDKEKLPLVTHEFDMAQPTFTDGAWEYSGMASFTGGGVEQRAIYRCQINEQGDLLLFAWGG